MRTSGRISESDDIYSLPQTSLMYRDKYQNLYLLYIDSQLWLKVHNLTDYYMAGSKEDLVLKIDMFTELNQRIGLLHPDRSCNNIIQVNDTTFMCLCKSVA